MAEKLLRSEYTEHILLENGQRATEEVGVRRTKPRNQQQTTNPANKYLALIGSPDDHDNKKNSKSGNRVASDVVNKPISTTILETGIISFFVRGRVGIDTPEGVDGIARTYILLRPIAQAGAPVKAILGNKLVTRILILPKKVLPSRGQRFMAFVAQANASDNQIKSEMAASSAYETQKDGIHRIPAAMKVCEGMYAFSSSGAGRATHLIYAITLPKTTDSMQTQLGLHESGSFIVCTKNPAYTSQNNTQLHLPVGPNFSEEIMADFRSLRWLPSRPAHLAYSNAQLLLIGERLVLDGDVQSQELDYEAEMELEELERCAEKSLASCGGTQVTS